MITKKIQNNKMACPAKLKHSGGFVVLFAVVVTSIILAITLGVMSIALKETIFSTSGKAANEAFFAADTGIECALYYDKGLSSSVSFPYTAGSFSSGDISCGGSTINIPVGYIAAGDPTQGSTNEFTINNLGFSGNSCATVTIIKIPSNSSDQVTIISKGRSNCNISNYVERQLEVRYY